MKKQSFNIKGTSQIKVNNSACGKRRNGSCALDEFRLPVCKVAI